MEVWIKQIKQKTLETEKQEKDKTQNSKKICTYETRNGEKMKQRNAKGNLSKTTKRILFVKGGRGFHSMAKIFGDFLLRGGGGYPLIPLSFFGHNDFPLRGGGITPNSVKEKIR